MLTKRKTVCLVLGALLTAAIVSATTDYVDPVSLPLWSSGPAPGYHLVSGAIPVARGAHAYLGAVPHAGDADKLLFWFNGGPGMYLPRLLRSCCC